jgi:predicted DNA-binding protein (UPF0251 family)
LEPRHGQSASESIAEADHLVSHTPLWHHMLRTIIAPVGFQAGLEAAAEGWLRVPMHSSVLPVTGPATSGPPNPSVDWCQSPEGFNISVPPHLARLGITARETEFLRLVNAGLSNADISHRLFISTGTVESHVSSMLQKSTGATPQPDELAGRRLRSAE